RLNRTAAVIAAARPSHRPILGRVVVDTSTVTKPIWLGLNILISLTWLEIFSPTVMTFHTFASIQTAPMVPQPEAATTQALRMLSDTARSRTLAVATATPTPTTASATTASEPYNRYWPSRKLNISPGPGGMNMIPALSILIRFMPVTEKLVD